MIPASTNGKSPTRKSRAKGGGDTWAVVDRIRERNADKDRDEVLQDVTAEVEAVRQERMVECQDGTTWVYRGRKLAKGYFDRRRMRRWAYGDIAATFPQNG